MYLPGGVQEGQDRHGPRHCRYRGADRCRSGQQPDLQLRAQRRCPGLRPGSQLPELHHLHRGDCGPGADPGDGAGQVLPGALQRPRHLPAAHHGELRHLRWCLLHGAA